MIDQNEVKRLLRVHANGVSRWLTLDIASQVDLLNAVASGNHDSDRDNDNLHEAVDEAHDLIMAMLFGHAWNGDIVDPHFWDTDIGRVMLNVRLWLDDDELITFSEAALILRGSSDTRDLVYINDQIKRGKLDRYTDLNEPNPQKAGRVSKQQVERVKNV